VLSDHVRADREPLEILSVELRTSFVGCAKSCVRVLPRLPGEGIASRRNPVDVHFSRPNHLAGPEVLQAGVAAQLAGLCIKRRQCGIAN
jgi:hypothetical protein